MRDALALIRVEAHITKLAAKLKEHTADMDFDRNSGNLVKYARSVATVAGLARSFANTMTELEVLVSPDASALAPSAYPKDPPRTPEDLS